MEVRGGEMGQAICSYCNYNFFNYCTTQLVMTVYETNVLVSSPVTGLVWPRGFQEV